MRPTEKFKLEPIPGNDLQARLVNAAGQTIAVVDGRVLEAQFESPAGFLVITADGNPFEEILHFTLLNAESAVIDSVSLGQIYNSGILHDLTVADDSTLQFRFFNDDRWSLHVHTQPRTHLKTSLGSPVRYSGFWLGRHYLELERRPD